MDRTQARHLLRTGRRMAWLAQASDLSLHQLVQAAGKSAPFWERRPPCSSTLRIRLTAARVREGRIGSVRQFCTVARVHSGTARQVLGPAWPNLLEVMAMNRCAR